MLAGRQAQRRQGTGLEARSRARPGVMIISALAILVVIGALWIGFSAKSERHPNEPQILQGTVPSVATQTSTPAPPPGGRQP